MNKKSAYAPKNNNLFIGAKKTFKSKLLRENRNQDVKLHIQPAVVSGSDIEDDIEDFSVQVSLRCRIGRGTIQNSEAKKEASHSVNRQDEESVFVDL